MKMFYFEGGVCQHSARLYERKDVPCDELDVFQVYMNDEAGTHKLAISFQSFVNWQLEVDSLRSYLLALIERHYTIDSISINNNP